MIHAGPGACSITHAPKTLIPKPLWNYMLSSCPQDAVLRARLRAMREGLLDERLREAHRDATKR